MALENDQIIWTGKTVGITMENYNGNYSIKACKRFTKNDGTEQLGFDWSFPQEWDKGDRKWKPSEKPKPVSVYLGSRDQAIQALHSMLSSLGMVTEPDDVPF